MDDKKLTQAKKAYQAICASLDRKNWRYQKNEEDLVITFGVKDEIGPIDFIFIVDSERSLVRLISPLRFEMSEENRVKGAAATVCANYGMINGNFDYDLNKGTIFFRLVQSFLDTEIEDDLIEYMIAISLAVVNQYAPKFLAIDKGVLSLSDFYKEQ